MRINTNVASLQAQTAATETNNNISSSLEKLSTGLKINRASDDASGLAIADKLRTQASSIGQGISNGNSASALIQIADKAMSEQSTILDTVKTKLIQAGTSTTSDDGREAIRKDITKLLEQFDSIASQTNYNGTTLLQNSSTDTANADTFSFQLGEDSTFDIKLQASSASNTVGLGGGADVFGASSINASVTAAAITAANTIGGSIDGSGTQHNNIGTMGSQQLSNTGMVSISAVDIDGSDGTEAASATTNGIDVSLSGQIGSVVAIGADGVFDFSNQSQELKDFAYNLAMQDAANGGDHVWDADLETLTVSDGESVAFGNLEVSSLRINDSGLNVGDSALTDLEINKGGRTDSAGSSVTSTFTVTNNVGQKMKDAGLDDLGLLGQLNVETTSTTSQLTGGMVLSELKDLGENGLTSEVANTFMSVVDESMTQLNANRSDFGSTQVQIESSLTSMATAQVNLLAAESVIRDVDYAEESANFNKQNIISQAGTYAMSQANAMSQNVMSLLQ
jgi:flagellin